MSSSEGEAPVATARAGRPPSKDAVKKPAPPVKAKRGRGRPPKTAERRGAHLRKTNPDDAPKKIAAKSPGRKAKATEVASEEEEAEEEEAPPPPAKKGKKTK